MSKECGLLTVKEIIRQFLITNHYDGLCSIDCECACRIDDLFSCGACVGDCEPGNEIPCDCGEHDFHIGDRKP